MREYMKGCDPMKLRIRHNQMEELADLHNEYPYAFHHVDLRSTMVPWHWHEELELDYVVAGSVKVSTAGQTQVFQKGEAFFINTNVLTAMVNSEDCLLDSHLFHPVLLSGHFKSVFETKYINPVTQNRNLELVPFYRNTDAERRLIGKLRQLGQLQKQPDNEFFTRNQLSEIWLLLLDVLNSADFSVHSHGKNQDRIRSMLSFIQENYSEKLTLEQIAASAAVSTRECLRCFQSSIRQTPMEYLMDYRIQSAKKLLETTDKGIADIALHCGFNSSSYFTKQFHKLCGKTPAAYRKELKEIRRELTIAGK